MARKEPKNTARRLEKLEKQRTALQLRKKGLSFSEIAEIVGCTKQRIGQLINESLQDYRNDIASGADELRVLELARLDDLQQVVQRRINASKPLPIKVDLQAVMVMLKIMQRRSELLGLDVQPKKGEEGGGNGPTGPTINLTIMQFSAPLPEQKPGEPLGQVYDGVAVRVRELGGQQ